MKVIDFKDVKNGTMVKRSAHCQKEMCLKGKPQIGIITDIEFFTEGKVVVAYPVVMWEGCRTIPSITHPALVDFYRKKDQKNIQYIDIAV